MNRVAATVLLYVIVLGASCTCAQENFSTTSPQISIIAREVFADNPEAIKAGLAKKLQIGDPAAFKALADRAFGRLPQPIEHSGNDGAPIKIIFGCEMPPWAKSSGDK